MEEGTASNVIFSCPWLMFWKKLFVGKRIEQFEG